MIATSSVYVDANNTSYAAYEDSNDVVWKLLNNVVNGTIIAGIVGSYGTNSTQLNYPNDAYVDRCGNLYVSDGYNHRMQMYSNQSTNEVTIAGITATAGASLNQLHLS